MRKLVTVMVALTCCVLVQHANATTKCRTHTPGMVLELESLTLDGQPTTHDGVWSDDAGVVIPLGLLVNSSLAVTASGAARSITLEDAALSTPLFLEIVE